MNTKKIIIIVLIILIVILIGVFVLLQIKTPPQESNIAGAENQEKINETQPITGANNSATFAPKEITKVTNQDIANSLNTNADAKEYMEKNSDFKITEKTILTKENIETGKIGGDFSEIYQNLELESNRYLLVKLMNTAGNNGLISILDFKESKVVNAYGLILYSTGIGSK